MQNAELRSVFLIRVRARNTENKKSIIFIDNDGTKYTLPLNNSEDTWFYKLIKGATNS